MNLKEIRDTLVEIHDYLVPKTSNKFLKRDTKYSSVGSIVQALSDDLRPIINEIKSEWFEKLEFDNIKAAYESRYEHTRSGTDCHVLKLNKRDLLYMYTTSSKREIHEIVYTYNGGSFSIREPFLPKTTGELDTIIRKIEDAKPNK